ncbi:GNAT family N-acetyltransferase [Amphibacillus cookii]|uniref:GNAT family N-acetyltransferase n=1 Tax=Amphibacillus cookii TaxID=767787 RepID=UPI001956DDEF|nr:GNAT family protein [Amphibacillus cookii]MBM7540262.1 ribosomal-protein-serine acetyltransferase [Amphibacillus cookii]
MFSYEIEPGIKLKPLEHRDTESLYQLITHSREHLRTFLGFVDDTKKQDDTKAFVESTVISNAKQQSFVAVIVVDEQVAGLVGFNKINWSNKRAEFGYWIGEAFVRKGIMTKAVRAIIDYGFAELDLNRIDIRAAFFNKASRGVAEKLGFVQEGVIREAEWLHDHFVDHVVYGLLKQDWLDQQN